jgi:4-diphosphocytidyl-2-C-methyl-D-erythritol kinase
MALNSLLDVPAPAKLNLFLHITGRRPDGYHLLQSAFVLIDWCDTLHFERNGSGRIDRTDLNPGPEPLPADDLSTRAARLLQQVSGATCGVDISLNKQVPWGAGLGGGSSDAASTLLALNRLWGLNWPRSRLLELGLKLGADVPFFIGGHNAWVEGVGELLTPLPDLTGRPWSTRRYAVLKPEQGIATAKIFGDPLLPRSTKRTTMAVFLEQPNNFDRNDLQSSAQSHCQQVSQALSVLSQQFGSAQMSGSGSAVFSSVSDSSVDFGKLLATLPQTWKYRFCQGLDQHPLLNWADDSGAD